MVIRGVTAFSRQLLDVFFNQYAMNTGQIEVIERSIECANDGESNIVTIKSESLRLND